MSGTDDRFRAVFDDLDELDAYIDARNAGQRVLPPAADDLAALFDTVERVRSLSLSERTGGEPERDFPALLAANLERELAATARGSISSNHRRSVTNDSAPNTLIRPAEHAPIPIPVRGRRDWVLPACQFVAAVVAFALVAGVLAAVLRGSDEPGSRTGSATDVADDVEVIADGSPEASVSSPASTPGLAATPDASGGYTLFDWERAAQVAAFELQQPFNFPKPFVLLGIKVEPNPDSDTSDPNAFDWILATYVDETDSSQSASIVFLQTLRPHEELLNDGATYAEYLLNDILIQKWTATSYEGTQFVEYRWVVGDVTNIVSAPLVGPITDPLLESFVGSIGPMVGAEDMNSTPEAEPTFSAWSDAQQAVYFELVRPAAVPETLFLDMIQVEPTIDDSFNVTAWYRRSDTVTFDPVGLQFSQRLKTCTFGKMGEDSIDIGGRQVRMSEGARQDGTQQIDFEWQAGELCLRIQVTISGPITEQTAVDFISSIPNDDVPATPATDPVSFSIDYATLTLSPDYGTCGESVTMRGDGFDPGTTAQLYGGGRLGDSFYPVADAVLVDESGSFLVEATVESIVANCDANVPQTSVGYRIGASTTQDDAKRSIDVDGPSAIAVFTLSSDVPAEVRERPDVPLCGTEEQFVEDGMRGPSGPNIAFRTCFVDAAAAGQLAEFISYESVGENINFEFIVRIYRSNADGTITILEDRTHDGIGGGGWSSTTCDGLDLSSGGFFEFSMCGEATQVE